MIRKWVALTTLFVMSLMSLTACNQKQQIEEVKEDTEVVFTPKEEMSKLGSISKEFDKENTTISYKQFYWDETTFEAAKEKYFNLSWYYEDAIDSGIIEENDAINATIAVMNDGKMVAKGDVQINDEDLKWYTQLKKELIGKNVGSVTLTSFSITPNDEFDYLNWMEEDITYAVSIKVNSVEKKIFAKENEEDLKNLVIPTLKEKYDMDITFSSMDDFDNWIKEELEKETNETNFELYRNAFTEYIYEFGTNATPNEEFAIEYGNNIILPYYEKLAKDENVTIDIYIENYYEKSVDEFIKEVAINEMKRNIAINEIATKYELTISKDDFNKNVENYYNIMANMNGTTIEIEKQRVQDYPYGFYFMYLQEVCIKFMQMNCEQDIEKSLYH